jgi:hypothetical protein
MGNYAHTGVAAATVRTMYATAGQVQDSAFTYLTSPAGTNTMTAIASLGMSAYATGQRFFFLAPTTNTGACTLNINSIGIKSITKSGTTALVAGDIVSGAIVQVVYDGAEFQILNPISTAVSTFSAGTTGFTPSTATTGAVTLAGTLAVANGGTGTASPAVVAGTGITVSGSFPNQTVNATITSGTTQASTSGTSIDFTSIPSWVKRITIMFNGVSLSGTSHMQVQVGSGSVDTSGYTGSVMVIGDTGTGIGVVLSAGFQTECHTYWVAASTRIGMMTLTTLGSNIWTANWVLGATNVTTVSSANAWGGGVKTTSGTLDRIRITTVNGTDTFDAGSINIMYE